MKKIYSKPEMQVVTIQQQGHLLAGSSKFYKFNKFENKDEKLEFKFDGFDDDEYDY